MTRQSILTNMSKLNHSLINDFKVVKTIMRPMWGDSKILSYRYVLTNNELYIIHFDLVTNTTRIYEVGRVLLYDEPTSFNNSFKQFIARQFGI